MGGSHHAPRGSITAEVQAWKEEGGKLLHRAVLASCFDTDAERPVSDDVQDIMGGVGVSDACALNDNQATPLHVAVKHDNLDLVRFLFEDCTDQEAKSKYGATPLHNACREGYPRIVKYLVDNDCDLNSTQKEGDTPLHTAVRYNKPYNVTRMVEAGADTTLVNHAGQTPMMLAGQNRCNERTRDALKAAMGSRQHVAPAAAHMTYWQRQDAAVAKDEAVRRRQRAARSATEDAY